MLPSAAMVVMLWAGGTTPSGGVREINIPQREFWYESFDTRVIGSPKELDALFEEAAQSGEPFSKPSDFDDFRRAVARAKVDFDTEVLWLVRHSEPSGSIRVRFRLTEQPAGWLRATVDRTVPAAGTHDVACYCFAVVVPRERAKKLVVGKPMLLPDGVRDPLRPASVFDWPKR